MIEEIFLKNEGSYDAEGALLNDLKELNFIFGANGSGKTTISRVIEDVEKHADCSIQWKGGTPLDTRVYNRDFVARHFDAESSIKGIYTFGENVEVADAIRKLKAEADSVKGKILSLRNTLDGEGENSGKRAQREALETQMADNIWNAKNRYKELAKAFAGVNNSKKKFWGKYLEEVVSNTANLRDIVELVADADLVFANSLTIEQDMKLPVEPGLEALEASEILRKKIVGKKDVDIASLINALENADWVQQGLQYYHKLDDQCPFCQQNTSDAFRQSLENYFDKSYLADLSAIDDLIENYETSSQALLEAYNVLATGQSPFLELEGFNKALVALRLAIQKNIESLKQKKKEPSTPTALEKTDVFIDAVNTYLLIANESIALNNKTCLNQDQRQKEVSAEVWKRLIEDTKAEYDSYKKEADGLDKAIESLEKQVEARTAELDEKESEINANEQKITSIKPTIEAINKLLKSFGFKNFSLLEGETTGFYEVRRPDGVDAKSTLSEGEKSFITFLYFYYLIRGSFSASGAITDRIVVFDDPVSSLDSDILFIVCNLIKGVVNEMRAGNSPIKQIFVLTHNIYFHKEITFDKKRCGSDAFCDETFWIIRKASDKSQMVNSKDNPIKSSYELLWAVVRQKPPSDAAIQNVMRRILEHYFKFFGGVLGR